MDQNETGKAIKSERRILYWAGSLTVVCVILMIWFNVYHRSVRYAREGDVFLAEGKLIEAVTCFETSAHAYTPWNKHVRHSMEKLWEIGARLEQENEDPTFPLIAYRSLRSSVYAIRSFYMPYKEWIPRCDEQINRLVAIQKEMIEESRRQAAKPQPMAPESEETAPPQPDQSPAPEQTP